MVLEQGLNADLGAELDEVLDLRAKFLELGPNRFLQVILEIAHPESLHAAGLRGAQYGFGSLFLGDFVDARGEDGHLHALPFQRIAEFRKLGLHVFRLDVTLGPDRCLDPIHTHLGGEVRDLIEGETLKMLGEKADLVAALGRGVKEGGGRSERGDAERAEAVKKIASLNHGTSVGRTVGGDNLKRR